MLSVKAQAKERGRNVKAGKFPFQEYTDAELELTDRS